MQKKQKNNLVKKLAKTQKTINKFLQQTQINYQKMKLNIKKIWLLMIIFATCYIAAGCNVTRTVTTESRYFQKGDTTCTITTKTVESYDATKKN